MTFGIILGLFLTVAVLNGVGAASGSEKVTVIITRTGYCLARVLVILVGSPFFAGVLLAGANALSGTPQVSDLLLGLKRYGLVLLASLMTYLCGIGVMVILLLPLPLFAVVAYVIGACGRQGAGLAAGGSGVGMIVTGAIWLVAYGLFICRLMFAPAIAADPTIGCIRAMDAMRRIWSMTSPKISRSVMGL